MEEKEQETQGFAEYANDWGYFRDGKWNNYYNTGEPELRLSTLELLELFRQENQKSK